tara:strand:- start:1389 stop:5102 length:3714 start_codon:yes stop_codon:yes gene_type:complete
MRIVLDLQGAQTQGSRFRGIGRYSIALAKAIVRNAGAHEVWIALNANFPETIEHIRDSFKELLPAERLIIFNVPVLVSYESVDNAWRRCAAELIRDSFLSEMKPDIIHISSLFEVAEHCRSVVSISSLNKPLITAVTLYDLIPLLKPKSYLVTKWTRECYLNKIKSLKRADLLLSISDSVLQEAKSALNIAGDKIVNISAAHTDNFRPSLLSEPGKQSVFARYEITMPYLMYNGGVDSRKNLDRLMKAFASLPPELRNHHQLLFASKVSISERLALEQLALELDIRESFILTGYVSDEDLVVLFTHCKLFIFPSIHEGFGLPALEAMACGAATIGSNATSISEVIGRADALFDPLSINDMAAKIELVLTDADFYQSLRSHAVKQAAKFSWDICAERTIEAFEKKIIKPTKSLSTSSWAEISFERDNSYQQLINAIATIPKGPFEPSEIDLIEVAKCIDSNRIETDRVVRKQILPENITWRIEGPFDSSYSLALLNRETARAMSSLGHKVILHSTEGPGDFTPSAEFLSTNLDLKKLYARSQEISVEQADVTSRNLYPPRVSDMNGRLNLLHHYAWEESGFPLDWVENFNEHLQGLTCLSHHVKKILIDHGVTVPMTVSGCGVDHWERIDVGRNYEVSAKTFRFIHVSSCFPRKGAELMLEAYGRVFTSKDDVTLVIKTFPNPHNEIHKWLSETKAGKSDFPDVLIIEENLSESQLKSLYEQCDVLVAPSKAEGFGLPMAEAMLSGLAVITTGWGGQMDFCNDETAWLLDYNFEPAETHFSLFDSVWALPDVGALARTMLEVFDTESTLRDARAAKGKELLLNNFRWSDVATRLVSAAEKWAKMPTSIEPKVGWVTTWNIRCGIATYSDHLIKNIPTDVFIFANKMELSTETEADEPYVLRCWEPDGGDNLDELAEAIEGHSLDTLIVQFNYGFFNFDKFAIFIERQLNAGKIVVLIMHATVDPESDPDKRLVGLKSVLMRCHRILVHTTNDMNRLKAIGLVENVSLFPHGIIDYESSVKDSQAAKLPVSLGRGRTALQSFVGQKKKFTIASYGFFLPHKGLLELIESVALLHQSGKKVHLIMLNAEYPAKKSATLIQQAKEYITLLGLDEWILVSTDYLPDNESMVLLAEADLIVYPYQLTNESSSAAVRYGIATGKPVAVTPLPIFDDVTDVVHTLSGHTPEKIARGISRILDAAEGDSEEIQAKKLEAERWCAVHRYSVLGQRFYGMLQGLLNTR